MATKTFKVKKLVRDLVPSILRGKGVVVHDTSLEQEEYIQQLIEKLQEEAEEVKDSQNADELIEELADVLEVMQSIALANDLSMEEIEKKRLEKRSAKGGFEKRMYAHHIDIEENSPVIHYYLKKPTQYPQINHSHPPDCLFCQIAHGKRDTAIFAKFRHCYVIKDQFPVSPGHILIIPYEHTENWFTAAEEVRLEMMKALHLIKEQLDCDYSPHGYNIGANCGQVAGQSVMHLHVHLIPRYHGDMQDPKGGVRGVIPSKQKY